MSEIYLPETLTDLWPRLQPDNNAVAVFAGGTDLFVQIRAGKRPEPEVLIGLERLTELKNIAAEPGFIAIGAAASHEEIRENPLVTKNFPLLVEALGEIGSPQIRTMGTLGGNLMTASPAADGLPPLYLYEAEVELATAGGTRRVKIADFITGPGHTGIEPGEILTRILLPLPPTLKQTLFIKVGLRRALAIAVVSLAALYELDSLGRITGIRLAWGSLGPTVVRLPEVEAWLCGRKPDPETLTEAGRLVSERVKPISDIRAGADYRRTLAGRLLLRLADVMQTRKVAAQ